MSQTYRLASGGRIDRSKVLNFTFNGKTYQGYAGDSLAAAGEAIGLAHTFSPWPLAVDGALLCLPPAVTCGFSPIL